MIEITAKIILSKEQDLELRMLLMEFVSKNNLELEYKHEEL